jgi:hypothetical protein
VLFGLFNLGPAELLILLVVGLCFAGLVVGIVLLVVSLTRRQGPPGASDRQAALEAENQRLREELARLKKDRA